MILCFCALGRNVADISGMCLLDHRLLVCFVALSLVVLGQFLSEINWISHGAGCMETIRRPLYNSSAGP